MNVLVVVQARVGSTRLPGKVLLPLAGATVLERQLERIRWARTPFDLVVATTTDAADDPIRLLCHRADVRCFSGHPTDLLDRHYRAALPTRADTVVKIPSDCPLIDPAVIDEVLGEFLHAEGALDFTSNLHPPSWPDGMDVEVMSMEALALAHREAHRPHEREHTTPFLWDQPHRFRVGNVRWRGGRDLSMSHRLTLDYPEDYALICAVFDGLWRPGRPFTVSEVVDFLDSHPETAAINARFAGVNWYRHHLADLATVEAHQTREADQTSEPLEAS